jgi:hypothetical protein
MSQILAMISAGAGCVATVIVWMMNFTPLPSCFIWPGILLPAVLIEFLTGSAKFLIYDTQICKDRLWIPPGGSMQPRRAEACSLSMDSIFSITASVLSLLTVLMVCLRAPKRRILDDNYGMRYKDVDNDMLNLWTSTMDDSACNSNPIDPESQTRGAWQSPVKVKPTPSMEIEDIIRQQMTRNSDEVMVKPELNSAKHKRQPSKKQLKNKYENSIGEINIKKLRDVQQPPSQTNYSSSEIQKMPKEQTYTDVYDENLSLRSMPKSIRSSSRSVKTKIPEETHINNLKEDSSYSSKIAPSDEGACFGFKSPLKAFKENFSPLKSTKSKKETWPVSEQTKAYDENKIMKCIGDLENSFSLG